MERLTSGARRGGRTKIFAARWIAAALLALLATSAGAQAATTGCPNSGPHDDPDLVVNSQCAVWPNAYHYRFVNVVAGGALRFLEQENSVTEFWASAIVIESGGAVLAGYQPAQFNPKKPNEDVSWQPFGSWGGTLTIHLWGADQSKGDPVKLPGLGVLCHDPRCGIPDATWTNNGKDLLPGCGPNATWANGGYDGCIPGLPTTVSDYFYQYGPLYGDDNCSDGSKWAMMSGCKTAAGEAGYFGYKVLAVSFGGTLQLFGKKGACYSDYWCDPKLTHVSWTRLGRSMPGRRLDPSSPENKRFFIWSGVDEPTTQFSKDDEIVITTTDYLPGHSEKFKIDCVDPNNCYRAWLAPDPSTLRNIIPFTWTLPGPLMIQEFGLEKSPGGGSAEWPHNGERYGGPQLAKPLSTRLPERIKANLDPDLVSEGVENRAAVALLTRSIRIVSEGDADGTGFPESSPEDPCTKDDGKDQCYSFGGHVVIRQGFQQVQIQGVEFRQLGQGGRMGHYPVHFHMARKTPDDTFVRDSSINESMTRWIVLHATQGVLVAGNVGYESIGHGFYLEDGSETDNRLYNNIGIFARAAGDNIQNFRHVPGILAYNGVDAPGFPHRSDNEYPSVFWITNGWNDFIGNMAVGAGTCGACYWFEPAENSSRVDVPGDLPPPPNCPADGMHTYMKWSGYADLQKHQCTKDEHGQYSVYRRRSPEPRRSNRSTATIAVRRCTRSRPRRTRRRATGYGPQTRARRPTS